MLVDVLGILQLFPFPRFPHLAFQVAKGKGKSKALSTSSGTSSSESESESEIPGAITVHDVRKGKVPVITDTKLITGVECVIFVVKEYERAIAGRKIVHQSMLAEIKVFTS